MAEVLITALVLSAAGSFYGTVLQIFKPFLHNKVTSNNSYRLYRLGILFFCIPFGSIFFVMSKWIGKLWNESFSINNMTGKKVSFISGDNTSFGVPYPVLNIDYELNTFLTDILSIIWLTGVIIFISVCFISQGVYLKKVKKTSFLINEGRYYEIYHKCREEMSISDKRSIQLWSNDRISIPFGTGLFKYNIWLPEKEFSDQELRLIFLHELTHVLHGDMPIKYLALLANGIHWYNPFFYIYMKEMDLYCELACDEKVMGYLSGEERKDYGILLIDMPKRRNRNYISLGSNFSHTKTRLYKIANPISVNKSSFLYKFIIGFILAGFLVSLSVLEQKAVRPWREKYIQRGGNITAYQNCLEAEYQLYQSYGLVYYKDISAFYYKGERVKVFLDEWHMTEKEREKHPWMDKAWQCLHIDSNSDSKLYLKTIRNLNNEITQITFLDPEKAEKIIKEDAEVVTFQSIYIGQNGFYASDRFDGDLPKEAMMLDKAVKKEHTGGMITCSNGREVSGYLYYKGGQYPWKVKVKNGTMKVMLYTLEGGDEGKPTIIQFASAEEVNKIVLYLDGKKISLKNFS